jgi:hypothetical protein
VLAHVVDRAVACNAVEPRTGRLGGDTAAPDVLECAHENELRDLLGVCAVAEDRAEVAVHAAPESPVEQIEGRRVARLDTHDEPRRSELVVDEVSAAASPRSQGKPEIRARSSGTRAVFDRSAQRSPEGSESGLWAVDVHNVPGMNSIFTHFK